MTEDDQMLTSVLDCRRIDLWVDPNPLTGAQKNLLKQMRQRREAGEPLQYIIGHCGFMGIKLFVDARALIPRPETEILVDTAVKKIKAARALPGGRVFRILDLGTGSGNIAVTLARYVDDCRVVAVDVSSDALALARCNARWNGVESDIEFVCADMKDFLKDAMMPDHFDLIISNPPYIAACLIEALPEDVRREPRIALDGGPDGLDFFRRIVGRAHCGLTSRGTLLMEIGDGQAGGLEEIFEESPYYKNISFEEDYTQTKRIVMAEKGAVQWTN
jgi:release factor glutamine methyltransferase